MYRMSTMALDFILLLLQGSLLVYQIQTVILSDISNFQFCSFVNINENNVILRPTPYPWVIHTPK